VRSLQRGALQAKLKARNVETLIHYPIACHLQPAFADLGFRKGDFPLAELLADEVLSLPFWPGMTAAQIEAVADAVRDARV
jgi:dTDP-4-amino-4,6-dideoxygalactose transaminase